jgi:D-lactate dehydrogenase (cytochrome)
MADAAPLIDELRTLLTDGIVSTDEATLEFVATDVYRRGMLPIAAITPGTVEELCAAVKAIATSGFAITVRGGGASYTDAYLAISEHSVLIDMTRLNRVVDIDERNSTVTVEAGCTWATLHEALSRKNLRTPFFGPFSGLVATVGGAVSQHAVSHGSGAYGVSAQSVLSLDVVLASGEILRTGSGAIRSPDAKIRRFFRYSGPDLTGLFTGDCGALGVKATVTLPLLSAPSATESVAFSFPDFGAMHSAMADIAQLGLDDENFGLDAAQQQGQIARNEAVAVRAKIALNVLRTSPSVAKGIRSLIRMAVAGDSHLREPGFSLNYIVKGSDAGSAKSKISAIRDVALQTGGEVPNSMPAVVAIMPFAPLYNVLGPAGERWVPVHGILQHSDVPEFHDRFQAMLRNHADRIESTGVFVGAMFQTIGPSAFLYEIAFYWPDERTAYHETTLDQEFLSSLPKYPPNPIGQSLVDELKNTTIELFGEFGAVHFQIGKAYPHSENRDSLEMSLLRTIKQALDPNKLMNPGALGL